MAKSKHSESRSRTEQNLNNKNKKGCYGRKKKSYSAKSIDSSNRTTSLNDNSTKYLLNGVDKTDYNKPVVLKESSQFDSNSKLTNNNFNNENQRNENYGRSTYNSNVNFNNNYSGEINEKIERTIIDRNPTPKSSRYEVSYKKEDNNRNSTSKSPSESFRQSLKSRTKQVYDTTYFNRDYIPSKTTKFNNSNSVTLERSVSKVHRGSINNKQKDLIPVLKTNKTYDISFTLSNIPTQNLNRKSEQQEIETIEYSQKNLKLNNSRQSEQFRDTDNKLMQTGNSLRKFSARTSAVHFDELMKDVDLNRKQQDLNKRTSFDMTDSKMSRNSANENLGGKQNTYEEKTTTDGNKRQNENRNMNTSEIIYSDPSMKGNISATEVSEVKEWMIVEFPDGHQEKREFRKEINEEGDVNYIDILNKTILKTDKASWKTGEEFIKNNKGIRKVKYEWRKDLNSNSWVKYDLNTNEILKQGDWKSGSEWVKNSKGKLVERPYRYDRNQNGQWIKTDPSSGQIIDYSYCSAVQGYDWVSNKNKQLKNRKWKKREYRYVVNDKGTWDKIDQETKKKIGKSTKVGWKEGIDHHMDKDGKVKKVRYIWETKENGVMEKVNKRNKEPVNYSWKEGREIIMRGDSVTTTNFAWVNIGGNNWVKIDQDTGAPITGKVESNKISSHNIPTSMSNQKSLVTKTTKRMDNDKIVEEKLKIEQNEGGVIKNTQKTVQYVK